MTKGKFNYGLYTNAVDRVLSSVGNSNGHKFDEAWLTNAPGSSNSAHDKLIEQVKMLHEFDIASRGKSFFTKRCDDAKTDLLVMIAADKQLLRGYNAVSPGSSGALLVTPIGVLTYKVNNAAERVDQKLLISALRASGVSQTVIDTAIKLATVESKPAQRFEVVAPL